MMSVASSPPAPTMAQFTLATTDPVVATDALNIIDDPTTQHWRTTSLASRAPPRALSPRIYGRSPRLPSALPLSASPGFVEHCAADGQAQHLLSPFSSDDTGETVAIIDKVDPASERERARRVANRMEWASSFNIRVPHRKNESDVVDENVADDLFSQVPRKYSGSGAPPLPAMSVPEFLPSNNPSQSPLPTASPPSVNDTNVNKTNTVSKITLSNNQTNAASLRPPLNTNLAIPHTMASNPMATSSALSNSNVRRDVPSLQLPGMELAPLRAQQPAVEPMPWEAFGRSPGFARSPGPLGGALPRESFREAVKEEVKQEVVLDVPTLSIPSLPKQMDRMDIALRQSQKVTGSSIAMVLEASSAMREQTGKPTRKRRAPRTPGLWDGSASLKPQAKKPPTQPISQNPDADPLCCTICGTRFARRSNLYKHLRSVHEEIRKFSCDLCPFKFKRQDHLIKHKRSVHAKVRKYSCEICGIGFAEKFNRDKHSRNIHSIKRAFRCPCGAYFQDKEKMLGCLKCKEKASF